MTLELVDAMLGKGKEYFGFTSNPLQINAPAVWLPYTVIDRLIMELEANSNDSNYKMVNIPSLTSSFFLCFSFHLYF